MARASMTKVLAQFRRDARGVTAPLFALIFIPVLGLALTAIDTGRVYYARNKLQAAVDSAAAVGAKQLGISHDTLREQVTSYLTGNLAGYAAALPHHEIVIADNDTALTVRMNDSIATTVAGIVGIPRLGFKVESTVERPAPVVVPVPAGEAPGLDASAIADELAKAGLTPADAAPSADDLKEAEEALREILKSLE